MSGPASLLLTWSAWLLSFQWSFARTSFCFVFRNQERDRVKELRRKRRREVKADAKLKEASVIILVIPFFFFLLFCFSSSLFFVLVLLPRWSSMENVIFFMFSHSLSLFLSLVTWLVCRRLFDPLFRSSSSFHSLLILFFFFLSVLVLFFVSFPFLVEREDVRFLFLLKEKMFVRSF